MSTAAMVKRAGAASTPLGARMTGGVYLLYFLTAILAAFFVGHGQIAIGVAANVVANALYVVVTLLFYEVFKPVDTRLSLLAALFSLVGCIVQTLRLFHLAPLDVSPFLFFGPYCILLGYLIFRSTFLPRALGVLMALAGLGWLMFLSPLLANDLSAYIKVLGIVAEGSLMLWLLIVGVHVSKVRVDAVQGDRSVS